MTTAESGSPKFRGKPLESSSQSNGSSNRGPSSEPPLTFGVELEFILAVHDEAFTAAEYAWLHAPLNTDPEHRDTLERQHYMHPELTWASRILDFHNLEHVAANTIADVHRWGVTPEITASPMSGDELTDRLHDRVSVDTSKEWRTRGVEVVSRVLQAPDKSNTRALHSDPALEEIRKYLTALHGNRKTPWGIFANQTCGLHVHIGLDPDHSDAGMLPLDVLQHLSYMLVQFETSISALHPRGRRALADTMFNTGSMLGSNLLGLRASRHVCDKVPLPLLQVIQDRIFGEDMTIEKLVTLMSRTMRYPISANNTRWKFVNFARLSGPLRANGARTIEFRQAPGCVDAEEIGRWVLFVTGLVRAAERLAARSKPASPDSPSLMSRQRALEIHMELPFARRQGNKYRIKCRTQSQEYDRLFDLMEMPRLDREYWMGRYREYNPEEVCGKDELLTISYDDCPFCVEEGYNTPDDSPKLGPTTDGAPVRSPESGPVGETGGSNSSSSMSAEEVARLTTVWGAAGGEGSNPVISSLPGNEDNPTNEFFQDDITEIVKPEEDPHSPEAESSSGGKRRRTGQSGEGNKRRNLNIID